MKEVLHIDCVDSNKIKQQYLQIVNMKHFLFSFVCLDCGKTVTKSWDAIKSKGLYCRQHLLERTSLEKYGVSHPRKSEIVKQKQVATCLKKYGTTNPLGNRDIIKKAKSTLLKNYGVVNTMHSQEIKDKIKSVCLKRYGVKYAFNNQKQKETMLKKYGTTNLWFLSQYRNSRVYELDGKLFDSSWEAAVYIFCRDHNLDIVCHPKEVSYRDHKKKRFYFPDFLINNEYVEVKGDQLLKKLRGRKLELMERLNVKLITSKTIGFYLRYVHKKYGTKYLSSLKTQSPSVKRKSYPRTVKKFWFNNGTDEVLAQTCPDDYSKGRLRRQYGNK